METEIKHSHYTHLRKESLKFYIPYVKGLNVWQYISEIFTGNTDKILTFQYLETTENKAAVWIDFDSSVDLNQIINIIKNQNN